MSEIWSTEHDGLRLDHAVARADGEGPKPAVLIFHSWAGRGPIEEKVAADFAAVGRVGIACDLYGEGRTGSRPEECGALMATLKDDRALLRRRLLHVFEQAAARPDVDADRIAAIGFCFGGLCALDLARAGAPARGVAAMHGLFDPPGLDQPAIRAKVIAFHGWDDPMAPPEAVTALAEELTAAGADWQVHAFGNTKHAFTNPNANSPESGLLYDEKAAKRAWAGLDHFLGEVLA